jgi:hypothetical protein
MGVISPSQSNPGDEITASRINTPVNQIAAEFNGNIDNANIKAGAAIATSKLADDAGITAAKIAADAVTAPKIDWASTGADGGIWWEEIGRSTLSGAADLITVSGLPSRKYLRVLVSVFGTGGTVVPQLIFNNDSTDANYNRRVSDSFAAGSASTSADLNLTDQASAETHLITVDVYNVAARNKLVISQGVLDAGDNASPTTRELFGQWENSTDIISRIDIVQNGGTGDFAIGSEVVVLGHN